MVDWQKVSEWVRNCDYSAEHKDTCQAKLNTPQTAGLRVIDTRRRCLTNAPAICRYAALSYVWGVSSTALKAKTANINRLAMEGSLSSHNLPQTIDDAIVACRKLEIDYLWVDRLCILQDDDPDKKAYWLNAMGDIYAQSYITIIALAGGDAEHGLPGVNKAKRPACWTGTTQGIYLMAMPPYYEDCLSVSKWATRGWTFQETTLATRRLLFSETGVLFECSRSGIIQDEIHGAYLKSLQITFALSSYRAAVEQYTKRELTWESDILRAFAGVLHTGWGPRSYYGLPLNIFSDAILWTVVNRMYPTRHAAPGDIFPTWSWSSVIGPIKIEASDRGWRQKRASLATWAIPSRAGEQPALQVVSNTPGEPEGQQELDEPESPTEVDNDKEIPRPTDIEARLLVVIAWKCGCFSGSLPSIINTRATREEYESIACKWKSLAQLYDEARGMPEQNMDARFPLTMRQECPPGSIFVYTQSLNLNLFELGPKKHRRLPNKDILVIEVGDFAAQVIPESINLKRINHVRQRDHKSFFHLLALSVTSINFMAEVRNKYRESGYDLAKQSAYDKFFYSLNIELMLVETEDGISRRVGLARAYFRHWINQNPQFRSFHLV
ncbi:hypothetical protein ABZX51_006633 [Aspergillus tubingensis]